jgi:hypothetical protein
MKLPSKLVTSLKSFTLPIIKSNVVKNTTSRFTLLFASIPNKISGWKHTSAVITYYKTLNNYHWFQLTRKTMKIASYINLFIISAIFVWHVDYYSFLITVRRIYSESFKTVFQPVWNTITNLSLNIPDETIINKTKTEYIDSSRIRELYTTTEPNLSETNPDTTSTDNINHYKEQVTTFIKNNQYYIIGGVMFIVTATGIYYYSNDITTWIAASWLTTSWSNIKEYFTSGNNLPDDDSTSVTSRGSVDSVISASGQPENSSSVSGGSTIIGSGGSGIPTPLSPWSPPVYQGQYTGLPLPEDNFSEANLQAATYQSPNQSPTSSSSYPSETTQSPASTASSSYGSQMSTNLNNVTPSPVNPSEIPLPSSASSSSASSIVESHSPVPSISVTESSPIVSPTAEIDASQVPLPESPTVRRSTDAFAENRIDRTTSVNESNLTAKPSDAIRRSKSS